MKHIPTFEQFINETSDFSIFESSISGFWPDLKNNLSFVPDEVKKSVYDLAKKHFGTSNLLVSDPISDKELLHSRPYNLLWEPKNKIKRENNVLYMYNKGKESVVVVVYDLKGIGYRENEIAVVVRGFWDDIRSGTLWTISKK